MSKKSSKPSPKLTPEQAKLVEDHIALARNIARKMTPKVSKNLLSYEDVESIAYLALCLAATSFDPSKGFAFTTYATSVVRAEIIKANRKGFASVSISESLHITIWNINKAVNNGIPETVEALSEALKESPNKIRQALDLKASTIEYSWYSGFGEHGSIDAGSFMEVLVSDDAPVDDQVIDNIAGEEVRAAVRMLPPNFRELIGYRFGFITGEPMLSEEVRELIGVDVDTYSNMESAAMEYLEAILRGYKK
jgi:RNA polymerase sigma factor (sigma-70 family)